MNTNKLAHEGYLEDALDALERRDYSWNEDLIDVESVPTPLYNTARSFEKLAKVAALFDATRQSREWFREAARFHLEQAHANRLRRDMLSRGDWCGEPQRFTRALRDALVSRDDHLTAEIATEALGMDECYLDEFADDYTDFPAYYYGAKALAAFALDHERAPELLAHLEEGIQRLDDPGQFWTTISDYYHALLDRSQADAQAALDGLFDYYAGNRPEPDDPKHFVLHEICAYILLARRYGLDITIDSERVPAALTREDVPADDVELDIDLSDLTFKSDVGLFELERDDDGTPVIAGRIYHPGGAEVTAADVPEREAGRVLSDDWIEAALDEASWRDHYGDDLVNEARAAFEDGSLVRKLVVVQDRTDGSLFDESLTELPVDDIELMKGAGKRGN